MSEETAKVGRLAMRVEGNTWNAYYAKPDSLEDAIFLGSIKMAFIENKRERRDAFVALMKECVADAIEAVTGQRPSYPEGETPAPESERSGGVQ
mgnify:CR=1 FL=1